MILFFHLNYVLDYHECFLRGLPEITCLIRRDPSVTGRFTPHPAGEPNFYMIAEQYPLPNDNESVAATGARESESSTMPSLAGAPVASRLTQEPLPVYDNAPRRPPPPPHPPQYNESYNHSYPQPQPFTRNGSDGSYPYDINQYQQSTSHHLPPPLSHLPSRNPSFSLTPAQYAQLYAEHHSRNRSGSYHSQPESYSAGPSHTSSQRVIHQHPQNLAQVTTAREHLAATYGSQYPSMLPPQPPPPIPGAYNVQGLPGSIQDQLGLGMSSNIQPPQAQAHPQDQSVPNGQPSVSPPFAKVDTGTGTKVQPSAQDLANSESKVDTDIDIRPAPFESVQFQQAGTGGNNNDQTRTNHVVSVQAPDQDSNEVDPADGSQGQQLGNDGNDHEPSSESPKQ